MSMNPEFRGMRGLSIRSILVACVVSLFVGLSSTYIAIFLSGLPWPIILSVVLSYTLLSVLDKVSSRHHNEHETNVAQAGGSVGGLIAAGVAFTIPAFWYLNIIHGLNLEPPSIHQVIVIAITGGLLGVALSVPVRRLTVEEEDLPFPSGYAGAQTLIAAEEGGIKAEIVLVSGLLAAMYACIISGMLGIGILGATIIIGGVVILVSVFPILSGIGAGYIIGKKGSLSWFLGALVGWAIMMPMLQIFGYVDFQTPVRNMGIGIVFGAGLAFFLLRALPRSGAVLRTLKTGGFAEGLMPVLVSLLSLPLLLLAGLELPVAVLGTVSYTHLTLPTTERV